MAIKAIETSYEGRLFRSRLEARWAVFFDSLRLEWQYEPEGFDINGTWYLPDFYVFLDKPKWIEIKPKTRNAVEWPKNPLWDSLAEGEHPPPLRGADLCVIVGEPCFREGDWEFEANYEGFVCGDYPYYFCMCPECGKVGLEFDGRSERIKCKCKKPRYGRWDSRLILAYQNAIGYRFDRKKF